MIHRTFEPLNAETIQELQLEFGASTVSELPIVVNAVEERLIKAAQVLVSSVLKRRFPSAQVSGDHQTIIVNEDRYQLLLTGNAVLQDGDPEKRVLFVTILPLDKAHRKRELQKKRVPIGGAGRFRSVELIVWPKFRSCIDAIAAGLAELFQAGYRWLVEYIRAKLGELATDSIARVYTELRRGFSGNPRIGEAILLMVAGDGNVYYIIDPATSDWLIHKLASAPVGPYAPVQLLVELAMGAVPSQNVIAVDAFHHQKTASINLRGDWVVENRPAYEMGEEAAFGTEKATAFPIVSDGQRVLAAGFPTSMRAAAIPVLKRCRADLARVFSENVDGFGRAWLQATRALPDFHFQSCFISFSTRDQDFATQLYSDLQSHGVRCWFAPHDMRGGAKIHEQIYEAIQAYDRLLLILSVNSMQSEWVKTEIAHARQKELKEGRRVLFPISLVPFSDIRDWQAFDADIGKDSAREIREYLILDFNAWRDPDCYQVSLHSLIRDLKAKSTRARGLPFGQQLSL